VNNDIGTADLSRDRIRLRITGVDCVAFLHGQCTNDIKTLQTSQSCYAAFLTAKGKMRGDAYVVCLKDAFLLDASEGLQASLEKFIITEDVAIEDVSSSLGAWLIVGGVASPSGGGPTIPAEAVAFTHPLGLGVLSPVPLPVTLDASTLDALRIEAGVPAWSVDMDENTIPVEAGLAGRAISYDKGCYIGQETIARIRTYGHVNRQLVQLSVAGDRLAERGTKILTSEQEVGQVTSAARSNRLGKVLALGYIRREFAVTGVKLSIGEQSAEVLKVCGQ
jgi:tRNA-modifying protein YgfZ